MINDIYFELSYEKTKMVWQFPKERFFKWEPQDETYCQMVGIGKEVKQTETICVPRAVVADVKNGEMIFRAISWSKELYGDK